MDVRNAWDNNTAPMDAAEEIPIETIFWANMVRGLEPCP